MKKDVLVAFDSMKYPNTGFFSFGKSLGEALIDQNKGKYKLYFYVHPKASYLFDKKVSLVFFSKLHRFFFPEPDRFALTHFTDQYCRLPLQKIRGKKILTLHDMQYDSNWSESKKDKHFKKLQLYITLCDKVVTISHFVASEIIKHFPEAKDKLSVIYNGADKLVATEGHTPVYQPQKPFLFTIGHISERKNFHVLPALLVSNDYELIISGVETPYTAKIMEEAVKYRVQDRLKITGTISEEDKAWYYKNCTAFVFPSTAEGFGLPVIEAMHFGKPVFLSTYTSLPEIGGDAAFYFDSFEPTSMQKTFADGMVAFDSAMQEKVIAHAEKFDWQQTAKEYLALYDECINSI